MKLFIKLFAGLTALLVLAVVVLLTVIDPNDYKEEIQTQVKNTINRDLLINGDISWTFYPQLGFSSGEIELNNLDGFNRKHLLKIDQASIGLDILPLLKGQIQIGELTLNGFPLIIDDLLPLTGPEFDCVGPALFYPVTDDQLYADVTRRIIL